MRTVIGIIYGLILTFAMLNILATLLILLISTYMEQIGSSSWGILGIILSGSVIILYFMSEFIDYYFKKLEGFRND